MFVDGMLNGYGRHFRNNDNYYIGQWKNNHYEGKGLLVLAKNQKYNGDFKNGMLNGFVTETLPNGVIFQGEYLNNKKNGQGKFISKG